MKIFRPWDNDKSSLSIPLSSSTSISSLSANGNTYLNECELVTNMAQFYPIIPSEPNLIYDPLYGSQLMTEEYFRVLSKEQDSRLLINNVRKQRPKKHKCPHCNVGFSNNGQLKGHIRIHTGKMITLFIRNNFQIFKK